MRARWCGAALAALLSSFAARVARAEPPADAGAPAADASPDGPLQALPPGEPEPSFEGSDAGAADAAPFPVAAPPPAPEPAPRDADWQSRYDEARARLLSGDFVAAEAMFLVLADRAKNPTDRALAEEEAALATEWRRRGTRLRSGGAASGDSTDAQPTSRPPPRRRDVRTADELGVLYVNAVLYGISTGAWTATMGEANDAAPIILPMLVFSGAAAGTVAILDSGRPMRYGVPQSIVSGMYIGLEEGIIWGAWSQELDNPWSGKGVATAVWGFSTAGAVAGGLIGGFAGTTPGRASFTGSAALWTGGIVGLLAAAATSDDIDDNQRPKNALLAAGIGLNVGTLAGILAAGSVSPSIARVRFIDLGGAAGGLVAGGLYAAAANTNFDPQLGFGLTAVGVAGGLTIAWLATAGMPEDKLRKGEADEAEPPESIHWEPTLIPSTHGGALFGVAGTM